MLEQPAVNKDRRCPADTISLPFAKITLDQGGVLPNFVLEIPIIAGHVEPGCFGKFPDLLRTQLVVVGEYQVMELPELSLVVSSQGREGCRTGKLVIAERKVLENQFDIFRVLLEHLLE